jgi:hypothetical protein
LFSLKTWENLTAASLKAEALISPDESYNNKI